MFRPGPTVGPVDSRGRPIADPRKKAACGPGVIVVALLGTLALFGLVDHVTHGKKSSNAGTTGVAAYGVGSTAPTGVFTPTGYTATSAAVVAPAAAAAVPITSTFSGSVGATPATVATVAAAQRSAALAAAAPYAGVMPGVVTRTQPVAVATPPAVMPAATVAYAARPVVMTQQPVATAAAPATTVTTATLAAPGGGTTTTVTTTAYLTPGQAQAIITQTNKNESDACMAVPSCNAYIQDCSVWSSQACTNVQKTCATVLGPPGWIGNNCTMGSTMPHWPFTYAMTPLQLAQYNCCVVNYKERTLGNFRAIQHTKGAPPVATLDAATGVVTMAQSPPPAPPRRAFGGV